MATTGHEEFVTSSNFKVSIDGHQWDVFESMSGLGVQFEDISYSGEHNVTLNRPGRASANDITFTRRFKKDPELYKWIKEIKEGKQTRKSGSVIITDDEGKEVNRFNFFGAWPKSWTAPTLSKGTKNSNDITVETIVLSVQDVEMSA
jgi:phage tail-like protein